MLGRLVALCLLLGVLGCGGTGQGDSDSSEPEQDSVSFGQFEGEVVGAWNPNGRDMTLREDFFYVDSRKKKWAAPSGSVVNGASIPRVFWSVIGGPFEGRYRNASVIHDVACVEMSEPWEDVHKMFYEACRCGGVGEKQANLIYWAVHNFGPRWKTVQKVSADGVKTIQVSERIAPVPPPANIAAIAETFFEANTPTVQEIETLTIAEVQEAVQEIEQTQDPSASNSQDGQSQEPAAEDVPGEPSEGPDAVAEEGEAAAEMEMPAPNLEPAADSEPASDAAREPANVESAHPES